MGAKDSGGNEKDTSFASPRKIDHRGLRVIMIERGEPDYERLLALFTQMMSDVDTAITELKYELKRMAGGVVDADHTVLNIRDYRDVYSLQPQVIMEQLHKNRKRSIVDDSDYDSSF